MPVLRYLICLSTLFLTFVLYSNHVLATTSDPRQIVLTWEDDTKTTMTITWRTDDSNARTLGTKRIETAYELANGEIDFLETRETLIRHGWEGSGFDSPEHAFVTLAAGIMNYTGRDARFAYQFLLNNWRQYSEQVGIEAEILPDRTYWNQTYDGVSKNQLFFSENLNAFDHFSPSEENDLPAGVIQKQAESYTFAETSAWIHRVKLTNLEPGTTYKVLLMSGDKKAEPFLFRTAPETREAFSFIAGADSQSETQERKEMTALAASMDPEFILLTGDLVMSGMSELAWDNWFDEWHELMITEENRRIPILPALGNHDVRGWIMGDFETDAAFFANRFNLPEPQNYYYLVYGEGLLIITLDSGHTSAFNEDLNWFRNTGYYEGGPHEVKPSHDGKQKEWLENTLQRYNDLPWKIVQQHINAFATSEHYWEKPRYGRRVMHEHWIPLFEEYGVDLVHEGHGHRMKRTHPIYRNEINEKGVTYIGEGGWGTHMGTPDPLWFVADKGSNHHFWLISFDDGWKEMEGKPVMWVNSEVQYGTPFTIEKL